MIGGWRSLALACLAVCCCAGGDVTSCEKPKYALHVPGDATVTAMLDLRGGADCSVTSARGRLQAAALAWTVRALASLRDPPSVRLGAVVYDTCSTAGTAQKALVSAILERECLLSYNLGLVAGSRALGWLRLLADSLGVEPRALADTPPGAGQVARWLAALGRPGKLRVVASSRALLRLFGAAAAAASEQACVVGEHLLSRGWPELKQLLSSPGLVAVIGSSEELDAALDHSSDLAGSSEARWMFFPTDGVLEPSTVGKMPPNSLVILLRTDFTGQVDAELKNLSSPDFVPHLGRWALTESSIFVSMATSVMENIERLKVSLVHFCGQEKGICQALPVFEKLKSIPEKDVIKDELSKLLNRLKLDTVNEIFGIYRAVTMNKTGKSQLEEVGVFEKENKNIDGVTPSVKWLSDDFKSNFFHDTVFPEIKYCEGKRNMVNGSACEECLNFARKQTDEQTRAHVTMFQTLSWNNEAWVAAVVSIAALGVIGCAAITVFIAVRVVKGDILEGHPGVSFLLLVTIVMMYFSVLLYGIGVSGDEHHCELLCGARVTATCLSYALLFSTMIARGVMLASCDQEGGFMSHVNGYLQAVLCFFVAAVQVGLSLQLWLLNPGIFRSDNCSSVREGYFLPLVLSYDAFLLLVLVWVSPFIARSKRNYREGAFFMAATVVTVLVWIGWVSAYLLAPLGWRDAAAAGGLAATATGVLVTVFIPRTYLMVTTIVRDQLASALPALARASDGSVQNLHYRSMTSSQPLYDCVQPVAPDIGLSNPNFYSEHSTVEASGQADARKAQLTADNSYERYDTPPAPDNITRF